MKEVEDAHRQPNAGRCQRLRVTQQAPGSSHLVEMLRSRAKVGWTEVRWIRHTGLVPQFSLSFLRRFELGWDAEAGVAAAAAHRRILETRKFWWASWVGTVSRYSPSVGQVLRLSHLNTHGPPLPSGASIGCLPVSRSMLSFFFFLPLPAILGDGGSMFRQDCRRSQLRSARKIRSKVCVASLGQGDLLGCSGARIELACYAQLPSRIRFWHHLLRLNATIIYHHCLPIEFNQSKTT
jgi:hypothetical protein